MENDRKECKVGQSCKQEERQTGRKADRKKGRQTGRKMDRQKQQALKRKVYAFSYTVND